MASGNLTRLPGSLSILATRLNLLSPAGLLGAAGIAAAGFAIYEIIDSSQQAEANLNKLQNAFTAVGRGDLFNRDEVAQYVDDLRQIPGVSGDAAVAITNAFARSANGAEQLQELTRDVKPFAELIGKDIPQAAKILGEAFNDPIKGIQALRQEGVQLTAAQQEQITAMMAVNDVAGAQRVLLDAVEQSMAHMVDTSTGLQRFFHNLQNDLLGVNEQATGTRAAIDGLIEAFTQIPNASTRNLHVSNWTGSSGSVSATDEVKQTKEENDAVGVTNKMFDTGNSMLREQEVHKQNILKIQQGINAAEALGDDAALKRAYADLETENKRFYGDAQPKDGSDKVAEAQAKAESEAGLARIKTEQEVVDEKLRLGQISTADAVKQLKDLAAQEHEINLKRIADMRSVYARQGDRAGLAASGGDVAKENERYSQQDSKIDTDGSEATKKSQEAEMEGARRVSDEEVRTAQVANDRKVALGEMSASEEIRAEIEAANQKHAIDDAYYQSLLQHEAQDSASYQKTLADKLVAEQKFNQQVLQLQTKLDLERQNSEKKFTQSVTNGLNQTVNGVLTGTQTMSQAFSRLGQNIVVSVVEGGLEKVVQKVLENNATIEAAQTALNAFLEFVGLASAETQSKTTDTTSQGQIDAYAAVGAAAAAAAAAGGGPGAAAAAGAATFGIIEGFQISDVASAAGGWVVPSDQLAMVHENEMILPAHLSQGIAGMIAGGQGAGGGGHVFNNTFHVNAGDGVTAQQLPDMIVKTMSKAMRNGQFGGMRGG